MMLPGTMDISMSRIRTATGISVDPFEPVFSSVASDQILEIICGWDPLRLGRTQKSDAMGYV